MKSNYFLLYLSIFFFSCTNSIRMKNEEKGKLQANYQLIISSEKRILLDYETAPQPPYMQMIQGSDGEYILTLLNPYMNAIYFYDYEKTEYKGKIEYAKEGPNGIQSFAGYYIKNMDSIYVYNRYMAELVLTDRTGQVKQRISLRGNRIDEDWSFYFPQYNFITANPLIEKKERIILTGMKPTTIADSLIHIFQFTASVNYVSCNVEFMHNYPKELYGANAHWESPTFMQPFRDFLPNGDLVYSFPVSHNVYIASYGVNNYKTVYAGSNVAGTIRSINDNRKRIPDEVLINHFIQYDFYTAILHDPYRHLYYRYMLRAIPNTNTYWKKKPLIVIIMDEQFNYQGETVIGTGEEWNWENSFVTSEGLTMEYIDHDADPEEQYLCLKTFTVEKINK